MRTRNAAVILLILFAFFLTGCWSRREMRELGITGLVGIEMAENGVRVISEVEKPQKRDGGKAAPGGKRSSGEKIPAVFVYADGATMLDAIRNTTLKTDRKLFFPHIKVFVFSEEVARRGLAGYLDFIYRDHETRAGAKIAIAADASPSEIIGYASGVENVPSKYIQNIIQGGGKNSSKAVSLSVLDFLQLYKEKGKNPVAGVIRRVKKSPIGVKSEEYELVSEGMAVFLQDKLVGFLDGTETRGYNWVTGNVKGSIVVSPAPDGTGYTAAEIFHSRSKLTAEISADTVKLKVKLDVVGAMSEEEGTVDVSDPAALAVLEADTAQVIQREMEHTLQKVQREYRSDIFGFGQEVHREYPREWKNIQDDWDEIFARAETEVTVEVKLMRIGKAADSIKEITR